MPDWLFHWTHDEVFKEVLKALIPAIGYVFVGAITWIGIWRTSKIAKQTLEDAREATPPELLRLEKWSTILKDSEQYPKNVDMDINTIYCTYKDVLKRATLENRIKDMAIWDSEIEDKLLKIKPKNGIGIYPKERWKVQNRHKFFRIIKIIHNVFSILLLIYTSFLLYIYINKFEIYNIPIRKLYLFAFIAVLILYICTILLDLKCNPLKTSIKSVKIVKNITYRNCYYALREVFLIDGLELSESPDEQKERKKFENTKECKKWQKENPNLTSWNYGLSINWDNNPYKNNTNGLEPNHLPPSLFRVEAPKK